MWNLGIDEQLVRAVQAMYRDTVSKVTVGKEYSEEFQVGIEIHQGSVLSLFLFIIVFQAIRGKFKTGHL